MGSCIQIEQRRRIPVTRDEQRLQQARETADEAHPQHLPSQEWSVIVENKPYRDPD